MSINSLPKINQKEYLKKYLSGDKVKKKKKSKKHKLQDAVKVKIIDDNAGILPEPDIDEELLLTGEDAPQIVATYVEEDTKGGRKWKSIAIKEEEEEVLKSEKMPKASADDDIWGPKPVDRRLKDEFSPPRRVNNTDSAVSNLELQRKSVKSEPKSPDGCSFSCEPKKYHNSERMENRNPSRHKHDQHSVLNTELNGGSERTCRHSGKQTSPHPRKRMNSSDESPPHRRKRSVSADQSPQRQKRRDRSENLSPHCLKKRGDSPDQSPLRRRKRSADQSPPRRKKRQSSTDQSPPRRKKRQSSTDQSPPRFRRRGSSEGQRDRKERYNSVRHSPSRRKKDDDRYADNTSHRTRRRESSAGQSPTLRRRQNLADKRSSCPRTRDDSPDFRRTLLPREAKVIKLEKRSPDLSPVRKWTASHENAISKSFKKEPSSPGRVSLESKRRASKALQSIHRKTSPSSSPPPTHKPQPLTKTLDGKRTGLQDAETLRQECLELRRKEDELFAQMPIELSGRDAEVQVRSYGRRGKRAQKAQNIDPEEEQRKEAHEKKKKELYERWGKGLKQIEEYRAKVNQDSYEGSKPLARYSNDADLEKYLRDQERADDPMLEYMRKKRKDEQPHTKTPTMPTYQGTYPENRFGIRPGYRWDGVDRSNGYETKWFDIQNEKQAKQDEAYKYSVEDL